MRADRAEDNEFSAERIRELLAELINRARTAGLEPRLHVFGGSALALHFPSDNEVRATQDIDAIFVPEPEIIALVEEMADEYQLPRDWLNSRGKAFSPSGLPSSSEPITLASPEELVAMKLAAARDQDLFDLGILARHLGITSAETLVDLAFEAYGEHSVVLSESREEYVLLATDALARVSKGPGA